MADRTDQPLPAPFGDWPRPFAFALSGGGAFGSVQVGMLRALQDRGITPDLIVGSSAGALHGALLASGEDDLIERLTSLWLGMDRRRIFGSRRTAARQLIRSRTLADFDNLRGLIAEHLPVDDFDRLPIRFAAVATDVLTGEPELIDSGSIADALCASSAVPGIYPNVTIGGRSYVDGGVSANVPIRQAIAFGAKSVVVLDANPATMPGTLPHSVLGSVLHASMIMLRNQHADAVDDLIGRHPILHLPQVTPATQSSFDFENSFELIAAGHRHTEEFLRNLPALTDTTRRNAHRDAAQQPGQAKPADPPPPTGPPSLRTDSQPPPSTPLKL